MTEPDRRYRRWLAAYPKEYRGVRGEEILGTLLESGSEDGGPALRDALAVVLHGTGVRIRFMVMRFGRGRLPRSVRWATNVLVFLAAASWIHAATADNGPRNPSSHAGNVVIGVALIALGLLLRTWSRLLYVAVIATLLSFFIAVALSTESSYAGLLLGTPFLVPAVLLIVGWRRYMAGPETNGELSQPHTTQVG